MFINGYYLISPFPFFLDISYIKEGFNYQWKKRTIAASTTSPRMTLQRQTLLINLRTWKQRKGYKNKNSSSKDVLCKLETNYKYI